MFFDRRRQSLSSRQRGIRSLLAVGLLLLIAGLLPSTALANTAPVCYGNEEFPQEIRNDSPGFKLYPYCYDNDGDRLTYAIASQPSHGTVGEIKTDEFGSSYVEYTPEAGYTGADSFTYTASDGTLTSEPATAAIKVIPPPPPTCSTPADATMRTNTEKSFYISCWGEEGAGDVTYAISKQPVNGTATVSSYSESTVVYKPATDYKGTDSFSVKATNRNGTTEVTQNITVDPNHNTLPYCYGSYEASKLRAGAAAKLSLYCYDSDGDSLTYAIVDGAGPARGSLGAISQPTSSSFGASITYTSDGTEGLDEFQFKANDGFGDSTAATQKLEVMAADYNTKPTCYQSTTAGDVEAGATGYASPSCSDAEGDPLTYKVASQPAHGTVELKSSTYEDYTYHSFEYKPDAAHRGADSFTYTANDGREDSTATTVNFNVVAPKGPACYPQETATPVRTNTPKSVYLYCSSSSAAGAVTYEIVTQPAHGELTASPYSPGSYTYGPDQDYRGADSFTYKATNSAGSTEGTHAFAVSDEANEKPSCWSSPAELRNTSTRTFSIGCYDADGDPLTYRLAEGKGPSHGTLSAFEVQESSGSSMSFVTATYTPTADYVGSDSFTYIANDGRADSSEATQAITVREATWNTAPTCYPPSELTVERGGSAWGYPSCRDDQGDKMSYEIVEQPAHGAITQRTSEWGGQSYVSWEYRPSADYEGTTDSFSYRAKDAQAASATMTVPIKIVAPQPPRCSTPPAVSLRSDSEEWLWLHCYGSSGGGTVTYKVTKAPSNGELSFPWGATSGSVKYTPKAGFEGTDSFTYTASNSAGTSAAVTQTLNVSKNHNTAPQCWGDEMTTRSGTAKEAELYCWDEEADPLTYTIVGQPKTGSVGAVTQPSADTPFEPGRVTYTPGSVLGPDSFTYKANDGRADSATVSFGINVVAADFNSAPECYGGTSQMRVAQNASLQLDEDQLPCWDAEEDDLKAVITTAPAHGTLSAPDADGIRIYTPAAGYTGTDVIAFKASDGKSTSTDTNRIEILVTEPSQILTEPIQTPSGDAVRTQTYVDPDTGKSFVTIPRGDVGQFENGCMPITLKTEIKPGTGTVSNVKLVLKPQDGSPAKDFTMTGGDPSATSIWSATIDCVQTGDLTVEYDLTDGDASEHVVLPLGGIVLIDPQGVVHDKAKYDAAVAAGKTPAEARAEAAIEGATAVLERNVDGTWKKVPASSPSIAPNVNPQVTAKNGLFQWDVAAGTYRVVVTKAGYTTVTSKAVNIPPPVLDLHIAMEKTVVKAPAPTPTPSPTPDPEPEPTPTPTPDPTPTPTPDPTPDPTPTPTPTPTPDPGPNPTPDPTPNPTPADKPPVTNQAPSNSGSGVSTPAGGGGVAGQTGSSDPSPAPKPACFGLKGAPRAKCQANATYQKAAAKCSKAKGKKKSACMKKAATARKRSLAAAKCQSLKGKKKAACVKKAKKVK